MTLGFPVSLLGAPIQLLQYHGPPSSNAPTHTLEKKEVPPYHDIYTCKASISIIVQTP